MDTWVATIAKDNTNVTLKGAAKMVEVAASNLTTALKRVVEEAWPEYGPRWGFRPGLCEGGKLPPGGEVLVIRIRRVARRSP